MSFCHNQWVVLITFLFINFNLGFAILNSVPCILYYSKSLATSLHSLVFLP